MPTGGRVDQTDVPGVLRDYRARIRALEALTTQLEIAHNNADVGHEPRLDFEDGAQYVWDVTDIPNDRIEVALGLPDYGPAFIQLPLDPRTLGGHWTRTVDNTFPYNFVVTNNDNTNYGYWWVPIAPGLGYTFYVIGVGTTSGKNDISIDAAGPIPPETPNPSSVPSGDWIPIFVKTLSDTPSGGLPYWDDFVDGWNTIPNDDYGGGYHVTGAPFVLATVFDPAHSALNGGPGYYHFRFRCPTGAVKLSYLAAYVQE